jgi:hypothetical protein
MEYLFYDFEEYYFCTIHYNFNWAFLKQDKIITPAAMPYYL